jgi:hypothetical protein
MTSTEPAQPDAGTDVDQMSLEAAQFELRAYEPATAAAVAHSEEHRERRARLWRRLDTLTRSAGSAPVTTNQRAVCPEYP